MPKMSPPRFYVKDDSANLFASQEKQVLTFQFSGQNQKKLKKSSKFNMSISAESTTGKGDTTTDQDNLGPTFSNLEPSEELRLLRARIAELERQQSINSPTSSASFNLLEAAAGDRDKIAAEYGGGNESAAAKEGQQTNTDQLKKKLRAEMKEYQKEQQLNIVYLQKTGDTMREIELINRWNSAACHPSLALIGPDRMIVQQYGEKNVAGSVIAEKAMPENPYFEVKVLEETTGTIHIGLATKQMPLDEWVGIYEGTYAFECYRGNFWGHEVEGFKKWPNYLYKKWTAFGHRQFICRFTADLFPCVSLGRPGNKIEANFGPNFQWNIADGI